MFEYLAYFSVILVTGPQRSGTTIAARMIAQDTGLEYIDETAFGVTNITAWRKLVNGASRAVIQCPAACAYVHEFVHRDNLAVVLVRRPVDEIVASQIRADWRFEALERTHYPRSTDPIASIKYAYWGTTLWTIRHPFEIQYHELAGHPLWIKEEDRRDRDDWGRRSWR